MNIAIISITKNGIRTGKMIKGILDQRGNVRIFTLGKFIFSGAEEIQGSLIDFTGDLFKKNDVIIFVSAAGIAVRSIAPYLENKKTDPAIIVVDELGKNAISLLSGHQGGANELTRAIAKKIGGNPIITTASDIQGKPCVEDIARKHGLSVQGEMTKVNAAIVNGEMVGIISDSNKSFYNDENFIINPEKTDNISALIYISDNIVGESDKAHVILRPKNLIAGVGCKKGVGKEKIIEATKKSFKLAGKSVDSLKAISTIEKKAHENGISGAAKELGVPLLIVNLETIKENEDDFNSSEFVRENVGVGAVSEPCAVLGGKNARLILEKTKYDGITVAIAREDF